MEYEDFCEQLKSGVLQNMEWNLTEKEYEFYPDGYTADGDKEKLEFIQNTNMKYHNVEANVLMGDFIVLTFGDEYSVNTTRFSVRGLYEKFQKDGWGAVWKLIDDNIKLLRDVDINNVAKHLMDYEVIKERLIIRPINYTDNKYELKEAVHKVHGDIALVLYVKLYDNKERGLGTTKIHKDVFESWGRDFDEVWEAALINTNIDALPRMYMTVTECIKPPYDRGAFMSLNSDIKKIGKMQVPTVTTTRQVNGAIAMFYPGVKEKIAELFDSSFYVAFTSINDARIHHKDSISPRVVLHSLKEINRKFDPNDTLSRKVYYYDRDKKTFDPLSL